MITIRREPPLDTPEQILARGQRLYMTKELRLIWPSDEKLAGMAKYDADMWLEIANLSIKTGGAYSAFKHNFALPKGAEEHILKTGASYNDGGL